MAGKICPQASPCGSLWWGSFGAEWYSFNPDDANSQSARNTVSFLFPHRYASHKNWSHKNRYSAVWIPFTSSSGEAPKSKAKEAGKATKGGPSEKHWLELLVEFYDELKAWQSISAVRCASTSLNPAYPSFPSYRLYIPTLLVHLKWEGWGHLKGQYLCLVVFVHQIIPRSTSFRVKWRLELGHLQTCSPTDVRMEHMPGIDWNYWVHFGPLFIHHSTCKLTMPQIWQATEAYSEDSKMFLVYSPQTEDDKTVTNKCSHMQIIQKRVKQLNTKHTVSDVHLAVWAPQSATHFCCNGKVPFEEAYNEARWQRKSSAVLVLLMFLVCGILEKKEQRDESSFYCDVLCRENPPNVAQVRKVFGIFHCILVYFCDSTLYIYRYIHGRIAEVFPLPFLIFLSMIMLAEHCQVWNSRTTAGWLVSACRKLPSSWNVVIKMVRRGSAACLVHNGPYIHTDLPKSCIDHIWYALNPVQ